MASAMKFQWSDMAGSASIAAKLFTRRFSSNRCSPTKLSAAFMMLWQSRVLRAASSDGNASPVTYQIRLSAILAGAVTREVGRKG
jgi:hypothetical protein